MKLDCLDMEELFSLAISAGGSDRHAEAMVLLKTIFGAGSRQRMPPISWPRSILSSDW